MFHILFFSDVHYSRNSLPEEKRCYPQIVFLLSVLSDRLAQKFLDFCDRCTQRDFQRFIDTVGNRKWDAAICLGDMTPGTKESGLISEKSCVEAAELKKKLVQALKCPVYFVLGGHDVGYVASIGYKKGGLSHNSLFNASHIYLNSSLPFYKFFLGNRKFIALASSLVTLKGEFREIKQKQLLFLQNELSDKEKAFLLMHSPFSLLNNELKRVVNENTENIEAIVCGDTHSRFVGRVINMFLPFRKKVISVPSIIGFFGVGRGSIELTINGGSCRFSYLRL